MDVQNPSNCFVIAQTMTIPGHYLHCCLNIDSVVRLSSLQSRYRGPATTQLLLKLKQLTDNWAYRNHSVPSEADRTENKRKSLIQDRLDSPKRLARWIEGSKGELGTEAGSMGARGRGWEAKAGWGERDEADLEGKYQRRDGLKEGSRTRD